MNAPGECILEKNRVLLETKMNEDGWRLSMASHSPPKKSTVSTSSTAALFCRLRSAVNQTNFHFGSNVDAEREVGFTLNMLKSHIFYSFF